MLDPHLESLIKQKQTPMNKTVTSGLVKKHMDGALSYLDRVFHSAFGSFRSNVVYRGYQQCKPEEEYRFKLKRNGGSSPSKARYELSRSDLGLVKFFFEVDGRPVRPLYLYIPFCDETGLIHLRGTAHTISMVIEDPGLSITRDGCFFKVTCDKITINRIAHTFVREEIGITQRRTRRDIHLSIPYGRLYRAKQNKANTSKTAPVVTLPHYLFGKFGVTYTFKRYLGLDVVYGTESDITSDKYPDSEWTRYYSAKEPHPNNRKPAHPWVPSSAAIAIRTTQPTPLAELMVGGFFYVADCYTHEFSPYDSDQPIHWRLMMGKMVFNKSVKHIQMTEYLEPHFLSLDSYLDDIAKARFEEQGIVCEDIYEYMVFVMSQLDTLLNTTNLASMYGKELTVLPYVLSPIVHGIFYTKFGLMQQCKQTRTDPTTGEEIMVFTERQVNDTLNLNLKPEAIYQIKRASHGEISTVTSPSDNKMFKINNRIVLQQNASRGAGKRSESPMTDESKALDVSIAVVCAYLHLTKPEPSGRSYVNVFMPYDGGIFEQPERYDDILNETQRTIGRRNI